MNYEKEYIAALERAREFYLKLGDRTLKEEVEAIFPELKEPPGEKIRRELIEFVKFHTKGYDIIMCDGSKVDDVIAWIENKKPTTWSDSDKAMLNEIIDFFENGTERLQHDLSLYASWLKLLPSKL